MKNKKFVTTGLLAGLVAGTGAGLVLQSSGLAGASNTSAAVVESHATATTVGAGSDSSTGTGSTDDTAHPDRSARLTEILQPLVDDGTITADQMTKVIAALDAAGPMGGPGHGGGRHGRGMGLDVAATALGVTADELRTALQGGSTLAEVAASKGVDVQVVIDALVADAKTRIAARVTAGDITQAEADAKLADLTTRITDMVNNGPSADDHVGPGGPGANDNDDDDATTATTVAAG